MLLRCFAVIPLLMPVCGAAGRRPLLPQPQRVEYGTGELRIPGLEVRFATAPSEDDRSAARILAGLPLPGPTSGKAIVLKRTGAADPLPVPGEKAGADSREAYSIKVTTGGAEITARSSAGLYYGAATLLEMVEGEGSQAVLPVAEVRDWPAFAYRAVMMDMSHGPLPTEEEVKRQIDQLSRWKANQYYFYSETSIEMKGYPLLSHRARFTADQVKRIVAYARERHVDVVPCVEFYGHLHDLFRLEEFADLGVLPHGGEFNTRDPRTMQVIADWVDQLTGMFPSPYFHIGLDEPYELEKSAKMTGIPASKIYLDQLAKVAKLVQSRGKHVVYWADAANIFGPHPEVLDSIPSGVTAVPWKNGYVKSYETFLGPFSKLHVPQYASTSVLNYVQVAPDFNQTFNAVSQLMTDAHKFQAMGLLLTLWTDDGQVLMRTALPGMAFGMASCWQSAPPAKAEFFSNYARNAYPAAVAAEVGPALAALSDAETRLQSVRGFSSMGRFWEDPFLPSNLKSAVERREDYRQVRLLAEKAQVGLQRALTLGGDRDSLWSLLVAARMLDYAGLKHIYTAEIADIWKELGQHPSAKDVAFYSAEIASEDHSRLADLMNEISELREDYRAAWLAEYTPYRLHGTLLQWDTEYDYWARMRMKVYGLRSSYREGGTLPPLESIAGSR